MESVVSGKVSFSGKDLILVKYLKDAGKAGKSRLEVVNELNAGIPGFKPRKPLNVGQLNGLIGGIVKKFKLSRDGGEIIKSETDGKTVNSIKTVYAPSNDEADTKLATMAIGICQAYYVKGQRGRKGISLSGLADMLRNALAEDETDDEEIDPETV